MNKSDSERVAAVLEKDGYHQAADITEADLVILNTCSVRQSAENRVFGLLQNLKKLKKDRPNLITAVTGCVASKDAKRIQDKTDIVFNIKDLKSLPQMIRPLKSRTDVLTKNHDYLKTKPKYNSEFQAHVPIMTGCNNFCTYCVVPYARGREKSRNSQDIIKECESLVKKDYKEITLLGQNVNSYGQDSPQEIDFGQLLKKVAQIPGDFWIRFITSHPKDMSDKLIKVIAKHQPKVTPYIHLAVQSGSNKILKAMNRKYTAEYYLKLVDKIQAQINDCRLSTDIIVGFPGETAQDFQETVDLFKKARFNMAYISQYSPRPGTAAAKLEDNVPREEKKTRDKKLTEILEKISLEENQQDVGKKTTVLVEKKTKGFYIGKNPQYKTVKFKSNKKDLTGQFVDIKVSKGLDWGLVGKTAHEK